MNEDKTMAELRKIRDKNSKRHLKMTREERVKEGVDSLNKFLNAGKRKQKEVCYSNVEAPLVVVCEESSEYND